MNSIAKKFAMAAATVVAAVGLGGCSNANDAQITLDKAGFTDVRTTGWKPFNCSDSDTFSTGFVAKNTNGKEVSGVVCSGLFFKGSTIRY